MAIILGLEGEGPVEELDTSRVHEIKAGNLYAMNDRERYLIHDKTRSRVFCTFVPALSATETHDEDGSLSKSQGMTEQFGRNIGIKLYRLASAPITS